MISDNLKNDLITAYVIDKKSIREVALQFSLKERYVYSFIKENGYMRSSKEKTYGRKDCRKCLNEFIIQNNAQVYCRICCPSKTSYQRLKLYNLSQPEFDLMLLEQEGNCALCDEKLIMSGATGLNVDHCHVTGKIRGLLCHKCNMTVGFIDKGDYFARLMRLGRYISSGYHKGKLVKWPFWSAHNETT